MHFIQPPTRARFFPRLSKHVVAGAIARSCKGGGGRASGAGVDCEERRQGRGAGACAVEEAAAGSGRGNGRTMLFEHPLVCSVCSFFI